MSARPIIVVLFSVLLAGLSSQAWADAALDRAMQSGRTYLLETQQQDGAWPDKEQPVAGTSLAILALLTGDINESATWDAVNRGVDWLLSQQRSNGQIGNNMVEHAAATTALAQRLLMGPPPEQPKPELIREALAQATAFIVDAQSVSKSREADRGGWHFQPTFAQSDIYYSGWQILALYAAQQAGVQIETPVFDEALGFVTRSRQREGFGAQPAFSEASSRAYRSHTGVALLAGRLLAPDPTALEEESVTAWLDSVPPTWGGTQYRGHFFGMIFFQSHTYRHRDGDPWISYRERLYPLLLRQQMGDGHWESPGQQEEASEGVVASTAMGILVLAIDDRLLPLFWPRDTLMGLTKYN